MSYTTHLHAALRHPTDPCILLLSNGDGWQLPYVQHSEDFWYADVPVVNKAFGAMFNTPLWTLRQFHYVSNEAKKEDTAIFEVILLNRAWQPPDGARWVTKTDFAEILFAGIPFAQPDLAPSLIAYLTALEQGMVPDQRPAWARPGWEQEVRAWIASELARHGYTLRELEQRKQWGISSVLRATTDGKDVYFKTTNPHMSLFVNEARVTQRLSELFPAYIPVPLSVDIDRDWMLLAEFDQLFQRDMPIETKAEAFRRFAELQIQTIGQEETLLAAGCLDRRIDVMLAQLDPLLADPVATHKLTPDQTAELRALTPTIKDLLLQLATCNLPPTLVHGDLHLGNAALVHGQTIYFDWTDACLAHPFIDLHSLAWVKDETNREAILTAYLEPWTAFAPMERLREIFHLAYTLLPLHHAVSYQYIINNLEPDSKPEVDMTHEFLEQLRVRVRVREYLKQDV